MIFVSRLVPAARAAFPYAAGVARMGYLRFAALATLGSIVWITGLAVLGRAVGQSWPRWRSHLEYVDYAAVALVVLLVIYLVVRRRRRAAGGDPGDLAPPESAEPSMDAISH